MGWENIVASIFCLGGLNPFCITACATTSAQDKRMSDGSIEVTGESQESSEEALQIARQKANAICDDEIKEQNYSLDTYSERVGMVFEPRYIKICKPNGIRSGNFCWNRRIAFFANGWRAYIKFRCL